MSKTVIRDLYRGLLMNTHSKRSYTRYMFIRRRNRNRKAMTVANAELDG